MTWFPGYEPVHVAKDVGMIPRLLTEKYGVSSKVVDDSIIELAFRFLSGERYDVFQVYHYTYRSLLGGLLYRIFNHNGKLYMKLDTDCVDTDNLLSVSRLLFKLSHYNIVSGEHEYIRTFKGQNVLFLPGFVDVPALVSVKEDLIIHAGRLGIPEKDSIRALQLFDGLRKRYPSWRLVLAGCMTPEFRKHLELYYPDSMGGSLYVLGTMGREYLFEWMARSKIVLSTNRSESFGYAVVEAMSLGCVPVTTDLPAYREHTDNGRYGFLDLDLEKAINMDLSAMAVDGSRYVRGRYSPNNIERLWELIR